jgi:hypothetical protein
MRQAVERAAALKLTAGDLKVLNAVLVLTASYSRLQEFVYVAKLAELAGCSEKTARRALVKLTRGGVLRWEPRRGIGKSGTGRKSLVGLPPPPVNRTTGVQFPPVDNGDKPDNRCPPKLDNSCPNTEKSLLEEVLGVLNAPTANLSGEGEVGPCAVCDLIDEGGATYRGGQWWCADHAEKSR